MNDNHFINQIKSWGTIIEKDKLNWHNKGICTSFDYNIAPFYYIQHFLYSVDISFSLSRDFRENPKTD